MTDTYVGPDEVDDDPREEALTDSERNERISEGRP